MSKLTRELAALSAHQQAAESAVDAMLVAIASAVRVMEAARRENRLPSVESAGDVAARAAGLFALVGIAGTLRSVVERLAGDGVDR